MNLRKRALDYLHAHRVLSLATFGDQGVWVSPLYYANDIFSLFFLSSPTTRHSQNIETNPRVAATIYEDNEDWKEIKGIQIEGEAKLISGSNQLNVIARYTAKFPFIAKQSPLEIKQAMDNICWYSLTPTHLFFIDNSIRLGHRTEVCLKSN